MFGEHILLKSPDGTVMARFLLGGEREVDGLVGEGCSRGEEGVRS